MNLKSIRIYFVLYVGYIDIRVKKQKWMKQIFTEHLFKENILKKITLIFGIENKWLRTYKNLLLTVH